VDLQQKWQLLYCYFYCRLVSMKAWSVSSRGDVPPIFHSVIRAAATLPRGPPGGPGEQTVHVIHMWIDTPGEVLHRQSSGGPEQ